MTLLNDMGQNNIDNLKLNTGTTGDCWSQNNVLKYKIYSLPHGFDHYN